MSSSTRATTSGHAEVGEVSKRVIDAPGGREVRLKLPSLTSRAYEEGSVVPRGDAQDVGIVRGVISSMWVSVFMSRRRLCIWRSGALQRCARSMPSPRSGLAAVAPICCMASTKDVSSH